MAKRLIISLVAIFCVAAVERCAAESSNCNTRGGLSGDYTVASGLWGVADKVYLASGGRPTVCYTLKKYLANGAGGVDFQWQLGPRTPNVVAYPRVTFGWDWDEGARTFRALRLGDIEDLAVDYSGSGSNDEAFNESFDIWIGASDAPGKSSITAEVMIWLNRTEGLISPGSRLSDVTVDGVRYSLFRGKVSSGSWRYYAFVREVNSSVVSPGIECSKSTCFTSSFTNFRLGRFLASLIELGELEPNLFLYGASLGYELHGGTGGFMIDKFRVNRGYFPEQDRLIER